eukprot:jgi/Ulvmu1/12230/UM086_0020.1
MISESGKLVDPPRLARAALPTADSFPHFLAQLQVLHTSPHPTLRSLRLLTGALQSSRPWLPRPPPNAYTVPIVNALLPKLPPFSPRLLDLQLHSTMPEECLVPLTAILPQLSSLQSLKIDSVICGKAACCEGATSISIAAGKAYAQRWTCLLAAVAEHPALTSLLLSVHHALTPIPWPAILPRLQEFKLSLVPVCTPDGGDLRVSPAYLAQLGHDRDRMHASFPSLTSLHFRVALAPLGMSTCLKRWLPLGRTIPPCDSMEDLRICIEHVDNIAHDEDEEVALWRPVAGTVAACPNLTSFDICGIDTAASCPVVVPVLLRLTRLRLAHLRCSWPASVLTALAKFLAALTALREVQLGNHCNPDRHFMACLLQTLAEAPHFTALHLDFQMDSLYIDRSVLPTQAWVAVYRHGLRKLRSLEVVHLRGEVRLHESEQLWAALAAVPRLRELCLHALSMMRASRCCCLWWTATPG